MTLSRRNFLRKSITTGVGIPLWLRLNSMQARCDVASPSSYKAIVCIHLVGGNDGNNMIVPYSSAEYNQYSALRGRLALPIGSLQPLAGGSSRSLALHPNLPNVARLFNSGKASFVTNVGPLAQPITKNQALQNSSLLPQSLLDHTVGVTQWESSTTTSVSTTGWGGRIADQLPGTSGSLPMVLNAGLAGLFTTGSTVQGITVQGGTATMAPLPLALQNAALQMSTQDKSSSVQLVAQAAQLREAAWQQQLIIAKAQAAASTFQTIFPNTAFGSELKNVAQLMGGRSVIGASRQIFYLNQGSYDSHTNQLQAQAANFTEFDSGINAFIQALQEMGLADQVLICTHSDFNRSLQANVNGGSDHAWGNHQIVIGGGITGGKIIGMLPDLDFGGSQDLSTTGIWIPTLSVSQMAAGVGSWIGLSQAQLKSVFPDLANFPNGRISLA